MLSLPAMVVRVVVVRVVVCLLVVVLVSIVLMLVPTCLYMVLTGYVVLTMWKWFGLRFVRLRNVRSACRRNLLFVDLT